jgi:predicted lysophospholipase L1 biosynthesis ABC-type transport system permease subunit
MFAILPIVGGVLLGLFAPRRAAVGGQIALWAIAAAVLTATAPRHGGSYADGWLIAPALAVVSALTLLAGLYLARRRAARTVTRSGS